MQMDKGVLSLSGIGAREGERGGDKWGGARRAGQAVEASLSLPGDEGIHGGDDRREARASLSLAASGRPAGQVWKMQLRTGRG